MIKTQKFKLSEYLRIIKRKDGYALYHSHFGGLCIVDSEILKLLKMFESPKSIEDILLENNISIKEDIEPFLNIFTENYFIVESEYNERDFINKRNQARKKKLKTGKLIGVVQLIVTNLCNFKCKYCFTNSIYSSQERIESQHSLENKNMSPETAKYYINEVLKVVKRCENTSLHIQFFGGEPLANWKTIKFVLDTFANGDSNTINITYSIVTNGSLITDEISKYFKKYKVSVIVSFDSPKGRDRILSNGQSSIEKIINGLIILKKYDNKLIFNSVLSQETFNYFDLDLVDVAKEYGVSEIGVLFDLNSKFYEIRTTQEILNKLWSVYKYGKQNSINVTGYWYMIFQQILSYDYFKDRGYKTCSATGCQLSIEPSGKVFACKGSSGYFGDISNLNKLFQSPNYEKYAMKEFSNFPICVGCEIENFCSGFCLGPLEKKYNTIYSVERNTCNLYKKITRMLIEDIDKEKVDTYSISM